MNIVIINGSHRVNGNCYAFSRYFKGEFGDSNKVDIINLIESNMLPCNGCLICEEGEECGINDDFSTSMKHLLEEADLLIFATPTYFNMPSGDMVHFLDRTNCLCDYFTNNHKKCFAYLTGQTDEETIMEAYKCLSSYFEIMEMDEIASPIINVVRMPEELSEDVKTKIHEIMDML
jgi:multimeric flavodoxin WrbA